MANFSDLSATVLRAVQTCRTDGESHCYAIEDATGIDRMKVRVSLHSLAVNGLIEVKSTVRRKKTNGELTDLNVYGLTEKGLKKLEAIGKPKPKAVKPPKPKPVEQPKREPIEAKRTVCESPSYERYIPAPWSCRNDTPSPIRGCN